MKIKAKEQCRWDLVSLGEVMLRLDPGETRISTAREFRAWEGGGEYNVARGLRRCFGMETAIVTALADNPVGRLIEDLMLQGGVSLEHLRWVKYDGVGRTARKLELHRARVRDACGFGLLRPRSHPCIPNEARRNKLGKDFFRAGSALVPHRRNLLRPFRDHAPSCPGSNGRGKTRRNHHLL